MRFDAHGTTNGSVASERPTNAPFARTSLLIDGLAQAFLHRLSAWRFDRLLLKSYTHTIMGTTLARSELQSRKTDQLVHLDFVPLCCQEKLIMNDDKRLCKHYSIGAPADTQNGDAAGICRPGQASCHFHAPARFDLSAFSTTTRADSTCLRPGRRLRQMNYHQQAGGHEVSEICPRAPLPQRTVIHAAKIAYR